MVEVVLVVAAVYFFYQLYKVLGRSPENSPFQGEKNIIDQVVKGVQKAEEPEGSLVFDAKRCFSSNQETLNQVKGKYPSFDALAFFTGASEAFTMITKAYCAGDTHLLQHLLTPKLLASFEAAINRRQEQGLQEVLDQIEVQEISVIAVSFRKVSVFIELAISSYQKRCFLDKQGRYLDVHGDQEEMKDLWTFTKDMSVEDPTWFLSEARVAEE